MRGEKEGEPPSYYDISMLKAPVWTMEVGVYFFLGGLSTGAFMLSRLAARLGGSRYKNLTRTGTAIAAIAALPCAPLLISDLGDPKRFHHMLRVWKPSSPMNLGSWVLTGYSGIVVLAALREWMQVRRQDAALTGAAKMADGAFSQALDTAGIPLGLLLAGYTGVLLSTTATPIWSRNPWIGALFSASAVGAGASAVKLALEIQNDPMAEVLTPIENAAHIAETVAHIGFLTAAGELAKPLTAGEYKTAYWAGAVGAGIVLPELLSRLPVPKAHRRWLQISSGVVALVGCYALRAAFVAAGRPSANDPEAARAASRPKPEEIE